MDELHVDQCHQAGASDGPKVLVVSHRRRPDGYGRQPGYVAFTEAEDVLLAVSGADSTYLSVSPTTPAMRARRVAGRSYRRLLGNARGLPPLPNDATGAASDGPLADHYDLLVFVSMTVWDLPLLERLHDLRRRADRVVAWFPELWPSELADRRLLHEPFAIVDDLFVGVADSAPIMAGLLNRPVHYLPMAVDAVRFAALSPADARPIDVLGIGRRHPQLHDALIEWANKAGRHYVYDTISGGQVIDYQAHRENLADTYRRSSLALTHYAKFDRPQEIGDQREIPGRLWEGLASGAVMAGMPPSEELQLRRLGQLVVEELSPDPVAAVEAIDELCRRPMDEIRRGNVHLALSANDWAHRWATVFATAGMATPIQLQSRLDHLDALADSLDHQG